MRKYALPRDLVTESVMRHTQEEIFSWLNTVAGLCKARHPGIDRSGGTFTFTAAAYNLVRTRTLASGATCCNRDPVATSRKQPLARCPPPDCATRPKTPMTIRRFSAPC